MTDEFVPARLTPSFSYTNYAIEFLNSRMTKPRVTLADVEFDTIVGTGLSGTLVVPRLAKVLKVGWGIVRKEEERSHRERLVEGTLLGKRWLFVDDWVATGSTLRRVLHTMATYCTDRGIRTEFAGVYSYKRDKYFGPDHTW